MLELTEVRLMQELPMEWFARPGSYADISKVSGPSQICGIFIHVKGFGSIRTRWDPAEHLPV
jgi:hypothetical protein